MSDHDDSCPRWRVARDPRNILVRFSGDGMGLRLDLWPQAPGAGCELALLVLHPRTPPHLTPVSGQVWECVVAEVQEGLSRAAPDDLTGLVRVRPVRWVRDE